MSSLSLKDPSLYVQEHFYLALVLTRSVASTMNSWPRARSRFQHAVRSLILQDLRSAFRQRYWARSYLGYPPVRNAEPNRSHFALAALQRLGHLQHLMTQVWIRIVPLRLSLHVLIKQ